ncbi:MAG: DUF1553 domain-containing protein [Bryobacteraceae bacterium]|nr:DUF1553 domain-containing protein [Bryobacteraceae bacterium]
MRIHFAALWLPALTLAADFNRDIRPILSDRCFSCHGPDEANRKANLRLDTEAGARPVLAKIVERVTSEKKGLRMPPVSTGAALTAGQVDSLKQWIADGAPWQKHWSFLPPAKPVGWSIDALVQARLQREGLSLSPPAPKATLLRRVSLDLTGLPPTPEEAEAFLRDDSPGAYERVVDRLLASRRYGERMAIRWLDAARYADTNGYQTDAERSMWRWRDWVIEAFNKNMPFNQFTIEQLAGDLLPNPTRDQIIATGFNRNHRANGEGGSIGEEFLVEYAIDRVEATSTVWLGLTLGCARCHDHKYDPFTQREFYSMFAFFNNLPEKGKVFKYGNSPPLIQAPTREQESRWAVLTAAAESAERKFQALRPEVTRSVAAWEKNAGPVSDWVPKRKLLWEQGQPQSFDGKRAQEFGDIAPLGYYDQFTLAAWVKPQSPDGAILTRTSDKEEEAGYGVYLKQGKVQVNFILRWLDDCLRVESAQTLPLGEWSHVAVTYDGSREAKGIRLYVDGQEAKLNVVVDDLNQDFATKDPLRLGAGSGLRFTGEISGARIYRDALTPDEAGVLGTPRKLSDILASTNRSPAEARKLEWAFLDSYAPTGLQTVWREYWRTRDEWREYSATLPTVMIMQERPEIREAHILRRGAYDQPGDRVSRALPQVLAPGAQTTNRLQLAQWLVGRQNPLTARVTVNRFWQMLFGTGIVKTVEDFGSQGEWPTHPELLDGLAVEFMDSGWNVKQMLKTMVMSRTYQQSSRVTPDLLARDPENRLYARGPRFRWPAEVVRDQALEVSGLLVEKLGGPSVKPYQPEGLWAELSGGVDYSRDKGENLYRRSLYTYWKRAVPPPGMMTFDAAGREACVVRENRTNTPLQALALMNDEAYLEAARKLAERMLGEGGSTEESRLQRGFALALLRAPAARESNVLLASLHHYRDRYETDPAAATKLLAHGDSPVGSKWKQPELAAWTMLASLLLNLDETVTKE